MDERELRQLAHRGFRFALSLDGNRERAEDLLQEAWASVLAANGRMDKGYLFRAIRGKWIDAHRRRQVVAFVPLDRPMKDEQPDPREVDRRALLTAMESLRPEEREVLLLHVVEGYTAAEVGQLLDRPRNTVLTQLKRGRERLRAWFQTDSAAEAL